MIVEDYIIAFFLYVSYLVKLNKYYLLRQGVFIIFLHQLNLSFSKSVGGSPISIDFK